jgi:hypothetical protein
MEFKAPLPPTNDKMAIGMDGMMRPTVLSTDRHQEDSSAGNVIKISMDDPDDGQVNRVSKNINRKTTK